MVLPHRFLSAKIVTQTKYKLWVLSGCGRLVSIRGFIMYIIRGFCGYRLRDIMILNTSLDSRLVLWFLSGAVIYYFSPEAEFLDIIGTKILRVFFLPIHSHPTPLLKDFLSPPPPPTFEQKWFGTGLYYTCKLCPETSVRLWLWIRPLAICSTRFNSMQRQILSFKGYFGIQPLYGDNKVRNLFCITGVWRSIMVRTPACRDVVSWFESRPHTLGGTLSHATAMMLTQIYVPYNRALPARGHTNIQTKIPNICKQKISLLMLILLCFYMFMGIGYLYSK